MEPSASTSSQGSCTRCVAILKSGLHPAFTLLALAYVHTDALMERPSHPVLQCMLWSNCLHMTLVALSRQSIATEQTQTRSTFYTGCLTQIKTAFSSWVRKHRGMQDSIAHPDASVVLI